MALVVLLSTFSFTVDMHFCGDRLVDTAIFQKAEGCGMEVQKPSNSAFTLKKNSCCSDQQLVISGQDELQLSIDKITFEQQFFIAAFNNAYASLFEVEEAQLNNYKDYNPPLVVRELYKLDESYLI